MVFKENKIKTVGASEDIGTSSTASMFTLHKGKCTGPGAFTIRKDTEKNAKIFVRKYHHVLLSKQSLKQWLKRLNMSQSKQILVLF